MLGAGDTFFFAGIASHLWVVITDPIGPSGAFIAVNMTTVKDSSALDPTCTVKKGEHDFVRQDTQIYYLKAIELDTNGPHGVKEKSDFIQKHRPVSGALLKRIQEGALESRFMKKRFQEAVREQLKKSA